MGGEAISFSATLFLASIGLSHSLRIGIPGAAQRLDGALQTRGSPSILAAVQQGKPTEIPGQRCTMNNAAAHPG